VYNVAVEARGGARVWAFACGIALALVLGSVAGAQGASGGDIEPAWSPNGKQIAFARFVGANLELYAINSGGGGVRAITHGSPNHVDPVWSPDGKTILFSARSTSQARPAPASTG
jgi:Tol biopolymer transport system component